MSIEKVSFPCLPGVWLRPVAALCLSCIATAAVAAGSRSRELFREYVRARAAGEASTLPDYSYAGYHRSERPLPAVTSDTYTTLNLLDFGAVPDDGRSDRSAMLRALAAARAHEGPVVIRIPAGRFRLSEREDLGQPPLVIDRSGVVLKGSGMGRTELHFAEPVLLEGAYITVTSDRPSDYYWRGGTRLARVTSRPASGGFAIEVDAATRLRPGMFVNIDADLNVNTPAGQAYFSPHPVPEGPQRGRSKPGVTDYMFELHQIQSIDGRRVTLAEPIHLELNHMESVVLWSVDHIVREVGIEDLSLTGNYREQFKHHNGSRFGESFRLLRFEDAVDCWVRNVRFVDYSQAVSFRRCAYNTFMNLLMEGNPGHSLVTGSMSYGNLFAYVREQTDTHHGLGVRQGAANTVFLRCVQYANMEAHCGYARATLYDLNEGRFQPRSGGATFTPHHGKLLCFWNWKVTAPGSFDFWPTGKRYGYFMPPIIAGLHGEPFDIPDQETDLQAMESPGSPVTPPSLFEAQLARRLRSLPTWLSEQSRLFEQISRHSRVAIQSPADHTVVPAQGPLTVRVKTPPQLAARHVRSIELMTSRVDLQEGFETVARVDGKPDVISFSPRAGGPLVLRLRMTNSRGEVCTSEPVTVYAGDAKQLRSIDIVRAALLPRPDKGDLYSDFVSHGGAEARFLKESRALARRSEENLPAHDIAREYFAELQAFYRRYGRQRAAPLLAKPRNLMYARMLIDGDRQTVCPALYHYIDTMAEFDFGRRRAVCRLDIVWRNNNPAKPVRLELQLANDEAAWNSVVNDEPLWEFSVVRVGSTLRKEVLPGESVTSLYFPTRRSRFARLLFGAFPNEVADVRFSGPPGTE